ncbi:hypothetical protein [Alicyclobacillus sp. SO9]|uniref:coiled-coil domain-containing protein n=1 Tax=Alicyclobacillus sp. SO9 TaxID=2665646 RepID=UPI0018E8071F|nr:hypothetical protein [Alicyclobacillus sp. SO9]QQE79054.1 hypothetical protein GI364_00550 [Alicyclobacillus sp. SO9]
MKWRRRMFLSSSTVALLLGSLITTSYATSLSQNQKKLKEKQQQAKVLQNKTDSTASQIQQKKQQTQQLQNSLQQTQSSLAQTKHQIAATEFQVNQLQGEVQKLDNQIQSTQKELTKDTGNFRSMIRASYEDGNVPYLAVLFKSTNFTDFLNRLSLISIVGKSEHTLAVKVLGLEKQLKKQRKGQQTQVEQMIMKKQQLTQLQQQEVSLAAQKQQSIVSVSASVNALQQQEQKYSQLMHMTQSQISTMKKAIAQQEAALRSKQGEVTETALRYQNIPPQKLYNYVHSRGSVFTLQDIQTICNSAKEFNVNPALLVAITGQEEAFVPARWGSITRTIAKNPFNVYYSWQYTARAYPSWGLTKTSQIAARTVEYKLSSVPPKGENPIIWLNDLKNPRNSVGPYATDRHWAYGVKFFYNDIMNYVG